MFLHWTTAIWKELVCRKIWFQGHYFLKCFMSKILISRHAIVPMLFSEILVCTVLIVKNGIFTFSKSNWISKNWPSCGGLPAQSKPVQTREKKKKILSTAFSVVVEYVHICLDWDSIMLCFTANRLFIPNGLFLWPLLSFLAKKDTTLDFGVFNLGLETTWYFVPNVFFFLCLLKEDKFRLWSF